MGEVVSVGIPGLFGLTGIKTAYKDENILLGEAQAINFTGDGVTATLELGVLTVDVPNNGGGSVTVIDALDSTSTTAALSANQGRVLAETIDTVDQAVGQLNIDLGGKADIDSPALTGTPTAPTPDTNDSTTKIATMQAVQAVAGVAEGNAVSTAAADATSKADAAEAAAKAYADGLVVGLIDDRGNYDPTVTSAYPTAANNGSGTAGAVLKGDMWTISADGTMGGIPVTVGDAVRALVDNPAQTASNWAITQNNIIYVPENNANKSTDGTFASNSDTLYPSQKAVKTYVDANALTAATARYDVQTKTITPYAVQAADITYNGRIILKCTLGTAFSVTIGTPTTLLGGVAADHAGKSVNVRQGGAGAVTITGALEGNGTFTDQHETKTLIAQADNTWLVVGG